MIAPLLCVSWGLYFLSLFILQIQNIKDTFSSHVSTSFNLRFERWIYKHQSSQYTLNVQWTAIQSWAMKHDCSEMNYVPVHSVNGRLPHHITHWWRFTGTHSVKYSISTAWFLIAERESCFEFELKPTESHL